MLSIIHIVDDDEPFQTAMAGLLRAAGYEVRAYANAGDFLLAPLDETPGCILLDARMPGPSGLDLQRALHERGSAFPIIFVSAYSDTPAIVQAIKEGAADFLGKPVEAEVLLSAIQNALAEDAKNRLTHAQILKWRTSYKNLTARELEIFQRVVAGKMNKEIAGELGIAERTVKAHRARMMQRMEAGSLAELVHIAHQLESQALKIRVYPRLSVV